MEAEEDAPQQQRMAKVDTAQAPVLRLAFNTSKAGMDEPVKDSINAMVTRDMKNPYFQRQAEKRRNNQAKIDTYAAKIEAVKRNPALEKQLRRDFEAQVRDIEKQLDLSRHWVHVDLDMFFVAVEIRDNPALQHSPVAVGTRSSPGNSVISTSNYVARKFGVRSAMPTHMARQLCKDLVLLPVNMEKYKEASCKFLAIVEEYDPELESLGLDEATFEVSEYLAMHKLEPTRENLENLMRELRQKVQDEIKITASCGYAANPFLAKICSEKNKPDGQFFLEKDRSVIQEFVEQLDIRKIPGIGPQSEDILKGLGILTARHLKDRLFDLFIVFREYKKFIQYAYKSYGISRVLHEEKKERKSFNMSRTIKPTRATGPLLAELEDLARRLAEKLRRHQMTCCHVGVTVKFNDFTVVEKSTKLQDQTCDPQSIYSKATELFAKIKVVEPVRLVGISLSFLQAAHQQGRAQDNQPSLSAFFKKNPSEESAARPPSCEVREESMSHTAKATTLDQELEEDLERLEKMFLEQLDSKSSSSGDEEKKQPAASKPLPPAREGPVHNELTDPEPEAAQPSAVKKIVGPKQMPAEVECPVCHSKVQTKGHSSLLYRHIDQCLAGDQAPEPQESKRHESIDTVLMSIECKKARKKEEEASIDTMKRVKRSDRRQASGKPNQSKSTAKTLDNFFSRK